MQNVETLLFEDWFKSKTGFVAIRPEYNGMAIYEYRSLDQVKHHWYQHKDVAYSHYEELRLYLQV
ncbi:hypothetical protein [Effusibacillus consociatus]|uniref:Uncharacterized protein n=1 Tax=Effusibacillus consociatus TaxID=1117041 RepID=A0ABV9Q4Z0_9BACL